MIGVVGRKAFVFSFFALFLSFLIFSFGAYYLFNSDFAQENSFKLARAKALTSEIEYFEESYFPEVFSFSVYNVVATIGSNVSLIEYLGQNQSRLNDLVFEGVLNGTLRGQPYSFLQDKTLSYFLGFYVSDFKSNQKGSFNFTLLGVNLSERNPYYLTVSAVSYYNVSTEDNFSTWNYYSFSEDSFSISGLYNPSFAYMNKNYSLRFAEYYLSENDLDEYAMNETLKESFVKVYNQNEFKYTIGSSFLKRFLNISQGSFEDVVGFFSFDYDLDYDEIYDSSRHIFGGDFFGNGRLILDFSNDVANDSSSYGNDGVINGAMNVSDCIFDECFLFDGVDDRISVVDDDSLDFNSSEGFSISAWFRVLDVMGHQTIIAKSAGGPVMGAGYMLNMNQSGAIRFAFSNGSSSFGFDSVEEFDDGFWHNVIVSVNSKSKNVSLFVDGIPRDYVLLSVGNFGGVFVEGSYANNLDLGVGSESDFDNFFDGEIDEVSIFSKALSSQDVSLMFKMRRVANLDYGSAKFGKSLVFDGEDDYVRIGNSDVLSFSGSFSVGVWIKPLNYSGFVLSRFDVANGKSYSVSVTSDGKVYFVFYDSFGNSAVVQSDVVLSLGEWSYVVLSYDGSKIYLYVNGVLDKSMAYAAPLKNSVGGFTLVGSDYDFGNVMPVSVFEGEIDEVKFYNRSLSDLEVMNGYLNFDSLEKGCCNFISLVNYNLLGFNNSVYLKNVSSESKLFLDRLYLNKDYNVTLYRIINFTEFSDTNKEYYNLLLDECMAEAFHIFNFNESIAKPEFYVIGHDDGNCSKLISEGVY